MVERGLCENEMKVKNIGRVREKERDLGGQN